MKVDIIHETPNVEDQRDYGICYPLSLSQAMTVQYRRLFKDTPREEMVLSPQSLIDARCASNPARYLKKPYGLQTVNAYPVTWTSPDLGPNGEVVLHYKETEPKYVIKELTEYFRPGTCFKTLLEKNFGEHGPKRPMIGSMFMGPYAKQRTFEPIIYDSDSRTENIIKDEVCHAMLIVGVDTDDGKDYCTMKNSYGTGWGYEGFGQVHIKDIYSIEDIIVDENVVYPAI